MRTKKQSKCNEFSITSINLSQFQIRAVGIMACSGFQWFQKFMDAVGPTTSFMLHIVAGSCCNYIQTYCVCDPILLCFMEKVTVTSNSYFLPWIAQIICHDAILFLYSPYHATAFEGFLMASQTGWKKYQCFDKTCPWMGSSPTARSNHNRSSQYSHHHQSSRISSIIPASNCFPKIASKQNSCYCNSDFEDNVYKNQFNENHFEVCEKRLEYDAHDIPDDESEFQVDQTLRGFYTTSLDEVRKVMSLDTSNQKNDVTGASTVILSKLPRKVGTLHVNELLRILFNIRLELSDVRNYLSVANDCEKLVWHNLAVTLISAEFTRAHVEDDQRNRAVLFSRKFADVIKVQVLSTNSSWIFLSPFETRRPLG